MALWKTIFIWRNKVLDLNSQAPRLWQLWLVEINLLPQILGIQGRSLEVWKIELISFRRMRARLFALKRMINSGSRSRWRGIISQTTLTKKKEFLHEEAGSIAIKAEWVKTLGLPEFGLRKKHSLGWQWVDLSEMHVPIQSESLQHLVSESFSDLKWRANFVSSVIVFRNQRIWIKYGW
jgi:hypothetical protein